MLQFIPNAPSTFLWAISDALSQMIHSFELILVKGLIKRISQKHRKLKYMVDLLKPMELRSI